MVQSPYSMLLQLLLLLYALPVAVSMYFWLRSLFASARLHLADNITHLSSDCCYFCCFSRKHGTFANGVTFVRLRAVCD